MPNEQLGDSSSRLRGVPRPRDTLQSIIDHCVAVQKCLRNQALKPTDGGATDDALQLARTIEQLARLGLSCNAEKAYDIQSLIESMLSILEAEVDSLFAS